MSEAYRLKREAYVRERLAPVLHSLVAAALAELPADPLEFTRQWLRQRCGSAKAVQFKEEELPGGRRRKSFKSMRSVTIRMDSLPDSCEAAGNGPAAAGRRTVSFAPGDFGLPAPVQADAAEPPPSGEKDASGERAVQFSEPVEFAEEQLEGGARRKSYRGRSATVSFLQFSEPVRCAEEQLEGGARRKSYWGRSATVSFLAQEGGGADQSAASVVEAPCDFGLPAPGQAEAAEPPPSGDKEASGADGAVQLSEPVQFAEEQLENGARRKSYWGRSATVSLLVQEDGGTDKSESRRASAVEAPGDFGLPPPREACSPDASAAGSEAAADSPS